MPDDYRIEIETPDLSIYLPYLLNPRGDDGHTASYTPKFRSKSTQRSADKKRASCYYEEIHTKKSDPASTMIPLYSAHTFPDISVNSYRPNRYRLVGFPVQCYG